MHRQIRSRDGFTLIETLIVVAIIGLLAAIGIPMWLNSVNRTKQTQTVANMRQIAGAWEARAADYKAYTAAGATYTLPPTSLDPDSAAALLVSTYIRSMPKLDGWRRPLEFWTNAAADGSSATEYALRSLGRDGQMDSAQNYTVGPTHRFDCDIVYANGTFIAYPEGTQNQ